jgi:hypothetical protein
MCLRAGAKDALRVILEVFERGDRKAVLRLCERPAVEGVVFAAVFTFFANAWADDDSFFSGSTVGKFEFDWGRLRFWQTKPLRVQTVF